MCIYPEQKKLSGKQNLKWKLLISRYPILGIRITALALAGLCSFQHAYAQSTKSLDAAPALNKEASASTSVTRVITLGTQGGPIPSKTRAQPANAVVVGGEIYLVDAGNGVTRQMVLAGLNWQRVNHIFITHNHDDHNADWGVLMGFQWTIGRNQPVHVYGPYGTEAMLQAYLQYFEPNAGLRIADGHDATRPREVFKAHDLPANLNQPTLVYQDQNVKVTAIEDCHFHFAATVDANTNKQKSYAYRFETADKVIVFSGDTGACGNTLVNFAKDADLLVHEVVSLPLVEKQMRAMAASMPARASEGRVKAAMRHMSEDHTSPEEIGRLAAAAGVKKVVLTHFAPGTDSDPDSAYIDGVRKYFSGPVVAARDLMEF